MMDEKHHTISMRIAKKIIWIKENTWLSTNPCIVNYLKKKYNINISEKTIAGWTNGFFSIGSNLLPTITHMICEVEKEYENRKEKTNKIQKTIQSLSVTF